jgi:hypothetical protein
MSAKRRDPIVAAPKHPAPGVEEPNNELRQVASSSVPIRIGRERKGKAEKNGNKADSNSSSEVQVKVTSVVVTVQEDTQL